MGKLILVTGGSRSGKSMYAQKLAESINGTRTYIATCPIIDEEIAKRIQNHKDQRAPELWHNTIEEEVELTGIFSDASSVYLLDCLTLWVNNLMFKSMDTVTEEIISDKAHELAAAAKKSEATVIIVTNEIGSGIIPENAEARLYRDLVGRCNQIIASHADTVTLVSCGIPLNLKGGDAIGTS